MNYIYYLFLILPIAMIVSLIRFKQTLAPGVLFILNIINFGLFLLYIFFNNVEYIKSNQILYYFTVFLGVSIILALIIFPISLIISFFYNGIQIIKREGFSPKNLLSIIMPTLVILYVVFWRRFGAGFYNSMPSLLYNYLGLIIIYFLLVASAYFFSSAFNMIHPKSSGIEYIIVLGSGLDGEKVTPLLKGRIDKGIEVYRKNSGSKLIMSGGQGKDEIIPEAVAMSRYAQERGVDPDDILLEKKSRNTHENIKNSVALIDKKDPKLALVSTNYHIFRAILLANEQGIKVKAYGKPTKKYFAINAFIREIIGYLVLKKDYHIVILSILSAVYLLVSILLIVLKTGGVTI